MRTTASYFVWRTKLWALLPGDGNGPLLTEKDQRQMEEFYHSGASPEDFAGYLLAMRDSVAMTMESEK